MEPFLTGTITNCWRCLFVWLELCCSSGGSSSSIGIIVSVLTYPIAEVIRTELVRKQPAIHHITISTRDKVIISQEIAAPYSAPLITIPSHVNTDIVVLVDESSPDASIIQSTEEHTSVRATQSLYDVPSALATNASDEDSALSILHINLESPLSLPFRSIGINTNHISTEVIIAGERAKCQGGATHPSTKYDGPAPFPGKTHNTSSTPILMNLLSGTPVPARGTICIYYYSYFPFG